MLFCFIGSAQFYKGCGKICICGSLLDTTFLIQKRYPESSFEAVGGTFVVPEFLKKKTHVIEK